jgi:excisionase family DNA binding protein
MVTRAPAVGRLITTAEAAHRLTCVQQTIRRLLDDGELRGVKIGRNLRVDEDSLRDYLVRNATGPREAS